MLDGRSWKLNSFRDFIFFFLLGMTSAILAGQCTDNQKTIENNQEVESHIEIENDSIRENENDI